MRSQTRILLLLALVLALGLSTKAVPRHRAILDQDDDDDDTENPIRAADEDEIRALPGLTDPINFRQFSGYLSADHASKPSKFFHYWLVESQSADPSKDPLVLWLNGGPGCSSLGGLFTELGPFSVNEDGKTLRLNKFAWNTQANVIFLESPAGVGYSHSSSLINIHTDDLTASENYQALKSFMNKFPQYKGRPLYLTGESYAGVYLPTLGVLVDKDPEMNLKGIAIGNGYLDAKLLSDSLIFFAYNHGLIGKSRWDDISNNCCDGKPPARESCKLSGNDMNWSCRGTVMLISLSLMSSGLNPYNLYGKCLKPSPANGLLAEANRSHSSKEIVDRAMMSLFLDSSQLKGDRPFHVLDTRNHTLGTQPPCFDDHALVHYLNMPEVRQAIHVPKRLGAWDTCSLLVYVVKYPKLPGGLAPQMKELIGSKRNLTMLVYNGDVDTVCNFLGDEWFVDDLGRNVTKDYSIWKVDGQVAGFVKHYDGITFATIRGSGHMVPGDRPSEALEMFKRFIGSKSCNAELN